MVFGTALKARGTLQGQATLFYPVAWCLLWLSARCRVTDLSVRYRQLKPEHRLQAVTLASGVECFRPLTVQSRDIDKRRMRGMRLFQGFSLVVVLLFAVSEPKLDGFPSCVVADMMLV